MPSSKRMPRKHKLHTDARAWICILEVEDELCKILDGVDVVCGGGLIKPTPSVEFLVITMSPITLCPGSSPPSPELHSLIITKEKN